MTRFHKVGDKRVPFTLKKEAVRDTEELIWAGGEITRNAHAEIRRLEGLKTTRLMSGAILGKTNSKTGKLDKARLQEIEDLLDIERAKL